MTLNESKAVFGGGCFWCVEAIFQKIRGVNKVVSGYAGGHTQNPSYEEVSSGVTGHAEVVEITYDSSQVTYEDLLYIFFRTHNPTTLNQQQGDKGTQYRSVILVQDEAHQEAAEKIKSQTESLKIWEDPIVTEIIQLKDFYSAEDYHQNYYQSNRFQPYCVSIIDPKIKKLYKDFEDRAVPES